jgi:hypothetical protein
VPLLDLAIAMVVNGSLTQILAKGTRENNPSTTILHLLNEVELRPWLVVDGLAPLADRCLHGILRNVAHKDELAFVKSR